MARILKLTLWLAVLGIALVAGDRMHPRSSRGRVNTHKVKYEIERDTDYWNSKAQAILGDKLAQLQQVKQGQAKNIIMFLGDGMSMHTVTASRNLLGDCSQQLSFDKFPYVGLSKTYCVNRMVADSACTATAYLGGVKANYGTVGLNANVPQSDCTLGQNPENFVESIAKWAQDAGKDTGFVTTARVTHASPAGVYAHVANRYWENDGEVAARCDPAANLDTARQLVEWPVGKALKVVLGGGRSNFLDSSINDEEGQAGWRTDGRNLIKDWLMDKQQRNLKASYVWSRKGLNELRLNETEYVLGLFSPDHCPYHGDLDRNHLTRADPSLSEMTAAAIKLLQQKEEGFFLFVEGARIDMAHHSTLARKSLEDTVEFSRAVQVARELTSDEDTLIVVTSDHSHTMTINGYPYRDMDITGLASKIADDNLPFTILSYANGLGYYNTFEAGRGRNEITAKQTSKADFEYMSAVPLTSETHGGDDVAVFASGPFAQYFSGNYEQSNIAAMMARAANIGPFADL